MEYTCVEATAKYTLAYGGSTVAQRADSVSTLDYGKGRPLGYK